MKRLLRAAVITVVSLLALALLASGAYRLLPDDFRGRRMLDALGEGHTTRARLLIWLGTDADFQTGGGSAMHYAASTGDIELMKFLLRHGASVDRPIKFGITPLYEARTSRQAEAERFLLAHGANPDTSHIKVP
jgi:hypothetical protein